MTERVQRRMLAELQTENRILRQQVGNALAKLLAENKSLKMPMPAGRHRCPTCNNLCCNE